MLLNDLLVFRSIIWLILYFSSPLCSVSGFIPVTTMRGNRQKKAVLLLSKSSSSTTASSSSTTTTSVSSEQWIIPKLYTRDDAATIMNDIVMPSKEYGNRIALQQTKTSYNGSSNQMFRADDPRLFETYGEFPLSSLDTLVDRSREIVQQSKRSEQELTNEEMDATPKKQRKTIIDVGSGCGRLAIYLSLSLSSSDDDCYWDIHGIEIAPVYHQEAIQAVHRAIDFGYIASTNDNNNSDDDHHQPQSKNTIQFHSGPADMYKELLQTADIIFCYSTTFANGGFAIEEQAMVFDTYWNEIFSSASTKGIVITTEKIINPDYGWTVIDRINVPNPEVYESTGFIQQRKNVP